MLKGVEDATNLAYNFESIIKVMNKLLKTKYNHKIIVSNVFEKCLSTGFN